MHKLLRNANVSYVAKFLEVSLDQVDADSRAEITNNAYHAPYALNKAQLHHGA